jgi:hypothetical protein
MFMIVPFVMNLKPRIGDSTKQKASSLMSGDAYVPTGWGTSSHRACLLWAGAVKSWFISYLRVQPTTLLYQEIKATASVPYRYNNNNRRVELVQKQSTAFRPLLPAHV